MTNSDDALAESHPVAVFIEVGVAIEPFLAQAGQPSGLRDIKAPGADGRFAVPPDLGSVSGRRSVPAVSPPGPSLLPPGRLVTIVSARRPLARDREPTRLARRRNPIQTLIGGTLWTAQIPDDDALRGVALPHEIGGAVAVEITGADDAPPCDAADRQPIPALEDVSL